VAHSKIVARSLRLLAAQVELKFDSLDAEFKKEFSTTVDEMVETFSAEVDKTEESESGTDPS
jgi:hypothetical protein